MVSITRQQYMEMYSIAGAAMEVHSKLGRGMEEAIYQEALQMELQLQNIPYEREKWLSLWYKGQELIKKYKVDFVCYGDIMVELKSVASISSEHRSQLFNYMRMTKAKRGVLLNFGERSSRAERYIYDEDVDDFILLKKSNLKLYVE